MYNNNYYDKRYGSPKAFQQMQQLMQMNNQMFSPNTPTNNGGRVSGMSLRQSSGQNQPTQAQIQPSQIQNSLQGSLQGQLQGSLSGQLQSQLSGQLQSQLQGQNQHLQQNHPLQSQQSTQQLQQQYQQQQQQQQSSQQQQMMNQPHSNQNGHNNQVNQVQQSQHQNQVNQVNQPSPQSNQFYQQFHPSVNNTIYDNMMIYPQQVYQQVLQPVNQYQQYYNQMGQTPQRMPPNQQPLSTTQQTQSQNQSVTNAMNNQPMNYNMNQTNQYQNQLVEGFYDKKSYEPVKSQYLYNQGMQQQPIQNPMLQQSLQSNHQQVVPHSSNHSPISNPANSYFDKDSINSRRQKSRLPEPEKDMTIKRRSDINGNSTPTSTNTVLSSMSSSTSTTINNIEVEKPKRRGRGRGKKQIEAELATLNDPNYFNTVKEPQRKRGRPKLLLFDSTTNEYMDSSHPNYKQLKKELSENGKLTDELLSTYLMKKSNENGSTPHAYNEEEINDLMQKKDKRGRPRKFPIEETGITVKGIRVEGLRRKKVSKPDLDDLSKRPRGRPRKTVNDF